MGVGLIHETQSGKSIQPPRRARMLAALPCPYHFLVLCLLHSLIPQGETSGRFAVKGSLLFSHMIWNCFTCFNQYFCLWKQTKKLPCQESFLGQCVELWTWGQLVWLHQILGWFLRQELTDAGEEGAGAAGTPSSKLCSSCHAGTWTWCCQGIFFYQKEPRI